MRNSKEIINIIKNRRLELGLSQRELAKRINISYSALSRYESHQREFPINDLGKFAIALNLDLNYLLGVDLIESKSNQDSILETKIQNTINQLNNENKQKTYNYASNLLENQNNEIHELTTVYVTEKVAAGVGYSYGENETIPYYTDRTNLPSYDFATLVTGDSMTPDYEDGDIILLRQGYDSVNGDIYVIDYDGKSYVKKLYNDGTRFVLKSTNEKYDDIVIYLRDIEDTYFNIVGKVIDSFKPVKR